MTDQELIAQLGGPAKLAERLGFEKEGGVQRIQNWISRGIPAQVKVDFQEIFLRPDLAHLAPTTTAAESTVS